MRPPCDNPHGGLFTRLALAAPSDVAASQLLLYFLLLFRLVLVAGQYISPVRRGHCQIVPRKYAVIVKGEVGVVARTVAAPP